ncbi:LLM class oxidoreductase [Microbulbifer agarilyticus]|uniref:LLM class oxidoreductase n=1 Tax=Microbulbifer agarilyticus TaxID=260552 RepID=UPI001C9767E7|nr:LLM class oxidoreductase [Microbulbifer agarilyticus]MBY6210708.1 LLM class oxidoreductase [Microbulbifer agarilyticus]
MEFQPINRAYNQTYRPDRLSLGLVVPIENSGASAVPQMRHHLERVQLAETLGFSAVWLRDVPFNVPSFGDAGQLFDPFVYLGYLAGNTERIALGVASIVLPLRHPAHVAKSAASVDVLSNGRVLLGVASGDRPEEYPAFNKPFESRAESFRSSIDYINNAWKDTASFANEFGSPSGGIDLLPKPITGRLPLLITGSSRQSPEWLARNGDGWITYPRGIDSQASIINQWRTGIKEAGGHDKPATQSLYIDLVDEPDATPQPIQLGFRSGVNYLHRYLSSLQEIGINHVALNLRFNQADIESTLKRLAEEVLPDFS